MISELSRVDARRIALRAQGFGVPRPARPTSSHVRAVVRRLGAVQIDAVNVLVRSHYLPVYSRLGPYDRRLLDNLAFTKGQAFDYMAHAASLVPIELYGLLRWRMEAYKANKYWVAGQTVVAKRNPGYLERVLQEVTDRGPLTFKELADPARYERPQTAYADSSLLWWSPRPSDGKSVLEGLWLEGRLAVAGRRAGFERVFDLTERIIPKAVLDAPEPTKAEAHRQLIRHAARTIGVGELKDLRNVFMLSMADTRSAVRDLVDEGTLEPVTVEGSREPAYLDTSIRSTPVKGRALLGPFDSLLWERARNIRLFGFRHSFEIYVPESKRQYGYFVCPFLLDEAIVARVDLKADRAGCTLLVRGAFAEEGVLPTAVAVELAAELSQMAAWLGLDRIEVGDGGDLAPILRRAVRAAR